MAYKTVSGGERKYFKYSECNKGDVLVDGGTYLGTEQGKFGIVHLFDVAGETYVLNSAGQLNYHLDKIATGTKCRIVYDGKTKLTKGTMAGKDANQFIVQVDDGLATTPTEGLEPAVVQNVQETVNPVVAPKKTKTGKSLSL